MTRSSRTAGPGTGRDNVVPVPSSSARTLPVIILAAASALALSACVPSPEAAPETTVTAPSASPAPATENRTTSPSPTTTRAASESVPAYVTCDDLISPDLLSAYRQQGWVSWNAAEEGSRFSPFDKFTGRAPAGQLSCRYGAGPDVGTDNFFALAWAPISGSASRAAQESLAAAGYQRLDVDGVTQWATLGSPGYSDDEGWGETFQFSDTDVRWVGIRNELQYFAPPA